MRFALALLLLCAAFARGEDFVWVEAERPASGNFVDRRQNPFGPHDAAQSELLSGGNWLGQQVKPGETLWATYRLDVPAAGNYRVYARKFWRHGPFRWRVGDRPWQDVTARAALLDRVPVRPTVEVNWVYAGSVDLPAGGASLTVETIGAGPFSLDCVLLTRDVFRPRGKFKPGARIGGEVPDGFFAFDPIGDDRAASPIDLSHLNQNEAGQDGFVVADGSRLAFAGTKQHVRFWGVNVSTDMAAADDAQLDDLARFLAKRGVNWVRLHGPVFARDGKDAAKVDLAAVNDAHRLVRAMKRRGIYTTLSIYFPNWLTLDAKHGWSDYDGKKHPFGLLFFDAKLQEAYRGWWRALLTTPAGDGSMLKDEPALLSLEMVNEDSLFWFTFDPYGQLPAEPTRQLEARFAQWLAKEYGSAERAVEAWAARPERGDAVAEGRVGLLPAAALTGRADKRAADTTRFLYAVERGFYDETRAFLRDELGAKQLVTASNWTTVSPEKLTPLLRMVYAETGDVVDRHGYFDPLHEGATAGYALSPDDRYADRSALKLMPKQPGGPPEAWNVLLDTTYGGRPSMVSEHGWTEPNRYRGEWVPLAATLGSMQDTDATCAFFAESANWLSMRGKYGVMTPEVMGQFPAAALLYRQGLLPEEPAATTLAVNRAELLELRGGPRAPRRAGWVGKVEVDYTDAGATATGTDVRGDAGTASASGRVKWDFRKGVATVDAPAAQLAFGFLKDAGTVKLGDVELTTDLPFGSVMLVPLDGQPLATSKRMLLQVSSETSQTAWRQQGDGSVFTVRDLGKPPLVVRSYVGTVKLAPGLTVSPLGFHGARLPIKSELDSAALQLLPGAPYYLVERP